MKGVSLPVRIHLFASISRTFAYHRWTDIELGLQSAPSPTNTSLGILEREDVVDSSALQTDPTTAVAASEHMSMPITSTEPQPIPATTVDAETSLGPSSAQGAHIEDNDLSNVDNENAQPATPNSKHGEPLPAANDNQDPAGLH